MKSEIEAYVRDLSSLSIDTRKVAAAALAKVARNDTNRISIVQAGAIPPLVELLSDADTLVRRSAARALVNIAANYANGISIVQAGVIPPLVGLLCDTDTDVRRYASAALANITRIFDTNEILVARAGAIPPLVGLLSDVDTEVRRTASTALSNIVRHGANKVSIAQAGAIPLLVGLLSDADERVRRNALDVLMVAAAGYTNQILAAEAGAIPLLVGLLGDAAESVRWKAAGALLNIVSNNIPNQKSLIAADAIPILHELAFTGSPSTITDFYARQVLDACQFTVEEQIKAATVIIKKSPPAVSVQSTIAHTLTSTESGKETPEPDTLDMRVLDESLDIHESDIEIRRAIGRGGYGVVYEGRYLHQPVAIKRYLGTKMPEKEMNEFWHEVRVMRDLRHECLVRLLGVLFTENAAPGLVMEYGANGSLYERLHSRQEMSWSLRFRIAEELGRGLAFLHAKNIIHCDIKSLNAVLDRDMRAKWCDFGLAVLKLHTSTTTKEEGGNDAVGTLRWMAPELFSRRTSTPSKLSDVWALGMVLFELASREVPFKDARSQAQIESWIVSGEGEEVPADCAQKSPSFAALMSRCWAERNSRPTASEIACELENLNRNFSENTGKKLNISDESRYMHFSGHGK